MKKSTTIQAAAVLAAFSIIFTGCMSVGVSRPSARPSTIEDYDRNGKLRLTSILRIFENAGSGHSDSAGDGVIKGSQNGRGWVLTDWRIEIVDLPEYGEKLKAETWTEAGRVVITTNRNFLMYDEAGKIRVKASTRWVQLDLATGRPVKIDPELMARYQPDEKKVFEDGKMPKLEEAGSWVSEKPVYLRRSDIDFNNHVHNLFYLDFALDAIPEEAFVKGGWKGMRISYKTAVKEGESVVSRYAPSENGHLVGIYGNDGSLRTLVELYV